ncbi:MAG: hypothetical protein CMB75_04650 [Euryarchaeota archaeon]|nr:hypothetical protein [Euryarchaeota archaeon]|tara:strand:- start:823 stop:2520 length:1698 start_codon:yes stop_codon:yes gene_type:complete
MNDKWLEQNMRDVLEGLDSDQRSMMTELCILVDKEDNPIGGASKKDCHYGEGALHRAFSVLLFDRNDRLLVQKRASTKITFPSIWANTCCSHPLMISNDGTDVEESVRSAAIRKMEQELGISTEISEKWDFREIGKFKYSSRWDSEWIEREIDHVLVVRGDPIIEPNPNEVEMVEWLDLDEIRSMVKQTGRWSEEIVAPWFKAIMSAYLPEGKSIDEAVGNASNEILQFGRMSLKPGNTNQILDQISGHRERAEEHIKEGLSKISQPRLHAAMNHLFTGGGKRLRAMLPILVGEAIGKGHEGHYVLGACIEIIHNFTLVHDDIMDQDPVRRGLKAVHVEFDDSTAINAGDAMLALSFEMLADSKHIDDDQLRLLVKNIGEMVRRVAEGQQEDFEFEGREVVSEDDYLAMIEGKTSAMFQMCAKTGAIISGAADEMVQTFSEWGLMLGLCFQIMDDVIDLRSDTKTLGKTSGSDISSGKRTLIAIHALSSGMDLPNFTDAFGNEEASEVMINKAITDLESSGSLDYAWKRALDYHEAAHQALDRIESSPSLEVLRVITDFQITRVR